jgi:cysteine-rich repeat protein
VCGGGSPVTPSILLTGHWFIRNDAGAFGFTETIAEIRQSGPVFVFNPPPTGLPPGFGVIDPVTGAFRTATGSTSGGFNCYPDYTVGTAALDGRTYAGTGFSGASTPTQCAGVTFTTTGWRCGGGTLDPGEECDDGNRTGGDGCDESCRIEP